MGTKAHRGFQQPRRLRGLRGLPADVRARVGGASGSADLNLVTIDAGNVDQQVNRLADDFVAIATEAAGSTPVPEQLDALYRIWSRKRRAEGVSKDILELVVGRVSSRLNIAEALPA